MRLVNNNDLFTYNITNYDLLLRAASELYIWAFALLRVNTLKLISYKKKVFKFPVLRHVKSVTSNFQELLH